MPDINSYLDSITANIQQLRQQVSDLQLEERPAETSGLASARPATGRTGQRYFAIDTGAYSYWTGSAWAAVAGGGGSGSVSLQPATPGTADTGNINVSGKIIAGGNLTSNSLTTGAATASSLAATGTVSGSFLQSSGNIQATTGPYFLGSVPILDRGGTFPTSSLVDGERYWHTTYRSWFVYNLTDTKWRQEAPGVFASTFPTVSAGDAIAAPQMQVTRLDRNLTYYYDGTRWLSTNITYLTVGNKGETMPFTQATHELDVALGGAATNGVYLVSTDAIFFPNTAQSAVNFYTLTIANLNVGFMTLTGTTDTKTFTTGSTWYKMPVGFSSPVLTSAAFGLAFVMTPTAAPGTFNFFVTFGYRLIG